MLELSDAQGMWLDGKLAHAAGLAVPLFDLQDPAQSKVVGKVKIDIPPGNPDRVATAYSWGFCAAAGSKNPDAAVEWVKWSTGTDMLAAFGKTWINPVPRASAIAKVQADTDLSARGQGRHRGVREIGGGIEDHEHGAAIFRAARRARHRHLQHHVEGDVAR